ncbi:MAG: hypothetical protein ACAH80_06730 [Alphaproteobacteria bacterium]
MTLAKPLRDAIKTRKKWDDAPLHQVIIGRAALEHGQEYARTLITEGIAKTTPFQFDAATIVADAGLQAMFRDLKNTTILITNIHQVRREATFTAMMTLAATENNCALVVCGEQVDIDFYLTQNQSLGALLKVRTDIDDADVQREMEEHEIREAAREITRKTAEMEQLTDVTAGQDVKPMSPIHFGPKKEPGA